MDFGTIISLLSFVFANPLVLVAVGALFVGWNLPQPTYAKFVQDKVVAGAKWLWSKVKNKNEEK